MQQIYQKLFNRLVKQHCHLEQDEFNVVLSYDIGIITKELDRTLG